MRKGNASLKPFFEPRAVAVVGASRKSYKPGHVIFTNFLQPEFKGKIYPINPKTKQIAGVKCYPTIGDVPEDIDLVIIAVPARVVSQVMRECVDKGVKAAIIISGGFGEMKGEGKKRENEIREIIKDANIRVIGPNCIGTYDAYTQTDTLFYPRHRLARPPKGSISFISQSGAYGGAVLDWAASQGIGISKFVSYGNMVDVNEIDMLEYLESDPTTRVIIVYMEQTANGRRLIEIAKRIVQKKPIIILKAGSTVAGAHAASSHTGALAGSDAAYRAAFNQAGIIRANISDELFDFALALCSQSPAKNNRIAILTNGGGLGVMATDELVRREMRMAELSPRTIRALRQKLPSRVSVANPIDLTGDADTNRYKIALESILRDRNVDGAIVMVLFQLPAIEPGVVDVIAEANEKYGKPITVCAFGGGFAESCRKILKLKGLPCYSTPDRAVKAMECLVRYGNYLKRKKNRWSRLIHR